MPSGLEQATTQSYWDVQGHKNVEYDCVGHIVQQIQPDWVPKKKKTPDLCNFSSNSSVSPGTPMKRLFPARLEPPSYKRAKISQQLLKKWDNTVLSACHTWTSPILALPCHTGTQDWWSTSMLLKTTSHNPFPPPSISRATGGFTLLVLLGHTSRASTL